MFHSSRRDFFKTSLFGAVSIGAFNSGASLWAADFEAPEFKKGRPDTLFLTWQRDPTTTMIASWVGGPEAAEATRIRYSVKDKQEWQTIDPATRPYPAEGLLVFHAEMTGLTPGTQYEFQIGSGRSHLFQTMPAKLTDTFQFVSGGDAGPWPAAVVTNRLAAKQNPMFALIGGDLAYDNGVDIKGNLQFLRNYTKDMRDSNDRLIPLVVAIGNHETGSIDGRTQSPFFSALYGGMYQDRTYAALDFGDYLSLVLLDTGHMASIDGEQTDWLDRALGERTDRPHLIVAQHVPSYPSYRPFDDTGIKSRELWIPLFEKYNVDLVLEHHDHTFKRTHPLKDGLRHKDGLVYLGDGSWGALRVLKEPELRPYLARASSNFHVTVHRIEGEQRFHLALANDGSVADICTTHKRPQRGMGRGA